MTPLLLVTRRRLRGPLLVCRFITAARMAPNSSLEPATMHFVTISSTVQAQVTARYMDFYKQTEAILKQRLPHLGIGKDGFKPPF